jgi:hypothetical protein
MKRNYFFALPIDLIAVLPAFAAALAGIVPTARRRGRR